jgi:hypothetical protein
VRVDLIAAIHIADPSYYQMLMRVFDIYDAVLYELVAPKDTKPDRSGRADSIVSRFQMGLCKVMNLAFQLDSIDYTRPNFVHADLSPREFARIMDERGETFWSIFMRFFNAQFQAMQKGMGQHLAGPAVIDALRSKDSSRRLKFLLAQEIEHMENLFAHMDSGKEEGQGSILVGERNKAAIEVLKAEIKKGGKKFAIFYGGGHMPDMESRLQRELGFRKKNQEWITAWDIRAGNDGD